ncbi:MAG TPA: YHYH protein [Mycobacteriales bacterium]|nr:YHYH protein [Mycobacteriales bacterium]
MPASLFSSDDKTYDVNEKVTVDGRVSWPSARHSFTVVGSKRIITTNDLPSHTTGVFPIASTDAAYQDDRNPNHIAPQNISNTVPAHPAYGAPQCMGGVVGVMTTGVLLFNGSDAGGRDAGAWEVQDHCDAHPDEQSVYHYHTLSRCIGNRSVHHVIGWALDGFPITGPNVKGAGDQLTTANLDVCHGITSEVNIDGKPVTTYHYVMTADFPYSMSCFRGTPVTTGPPA